MMFDFARSLEVALTDECLAVPKHCFSNAVRALRSKKLAYLAHAWYVEGHVLLDVAPIITLHAWLVLPGEIILDPTYAVIHQDTPGDKPGYKGYYPYASYTRQELKNKRVAWFPLASSSELAIREFALYTSVLGIRWLEPNTPGK